MRTLAAIVATALPAPDPAIAAIARSWLADRGEAPTLRRVVQRVDAAAHRRCGRRFAACDLGDRRRVLASLARDPELASFVRAIHVLFVSPPAIGANRGYRNWRPVVAIRRARPLPPLAIGAPPARTRELAGCRIAADGAELARYCRREGARIVRAGPVDGVLLGRSSDAAIERAADRLSPGGRILLVGDMQRLALRRWARALAPRGIAINAVRAASLAPVRSILIGLVRTWQPAPTGRVFDGTGELSARAARSSSDLGR